MYLGGDALKTRPSIDGFVLVSHGRKTPPVSESIWLFSLIYSGLTLMLTPPTTMLAFSRMISKEESWRGQRTKWFVIVFALVWLVGWEWNIGKSLHASFRDWSQHGPAK
jgi:hypothetical protein